MDIPKQSCSVYPLTETQKHITKLSQQLAFKEQDVHTVQLCVSDVEPGLPIAQAQEQITTLLQQLAFTR